MATILFIGGTELVVVFLIALLFFGADSIPGLARSAGKAMREFKKATNDIKKEFDEHTGEIQEEVKRTRNVLEEGGREIEKEVRKKESEINDHLNTK
ncbi:twin-arginine translocase TatA/TatE family subunit [Prolixibacteraceae bacterium]|nr:twin-arginine translocase TatA/TatE family subunit [Prolixibacteraceae bacterium]